MKQLKMKRLFAGMVLFATAIIATGCSNDDFYGFEDYDTFSDDRGTSSNENVHPLIDNLFLDYIDNQYVITISQKDAKRLLGLTKDEYQEAQKAIAEGNRLLSEMIESSLAEGKKVVVTSSLNDDSRRAYSIPRTKASGEPGQLPSGCIETSGQDWGSQGMWLPSPMASFDCDCYSWAALLPMQVVKTSSFGCDFFNSGIGQHVTMSVALAASNTYGGIAYKTSDSNGGKCAWKGSTVNLNYPDK